MHTKFHKDWFRHSKVSGEVMHRYTIGYNGLRHVVRRARVKSSGVMVSTLVRTEKSRVRI
jgi:hypothetical protein